MGYATCFSNQLSVFSKSIGPAVTEGFCLCGITHLQSSPTKGLVVELDLSILRIAHVMKLDEAKSLETSACQQTCNMISVNSPKHRTCIDDSSIAVAVLIRTLGLLSYLP